MAKQSYLSSSSMAVAAVDDELRNWELVGDSDFEFDEVFEVQSFDSLSSSADDDEQEAPTRVIDHDVMRSPSPSPSPSPPCQARITDSVRDFLDNYNLRICVDDDVMMTSPSPSPTPSPPSERSLFCDVISREIRVIDLGHNFDGESEYKVGNYVAGVEYDDGVNQYDEDDDDDDDDDDDGDDIDDELVPWELKGKFERQRMRKLGKRACAKMTKCKKSALLYTKPGCVRGKHGLGLKAY